MIANGDDMPVGASFSGGTSSLWPIAKVLHGELPRPRHFAVFFADTGDEHAWTYEAVDRTEEMCKAAGIPFFRGSHRTMLWDDVLAGTRGERKNIKNPPLWTENPGGGRGQLKQQCSEIYKTAVIRRMESAWLASLGVPKSMITWIGFGADEQHRAMKAVARQDVQWVKLDFPAIRAGASRGQQRADVVRLLGTAPRFSMCVRCPYKDPRRWSETPTSDLAGVFVTDEAIRHGLEHVGVREPCYLTDRLIPVERLIRNGDPQPSLPGFGPPGCDSGACFL